MPADAVITRDGPVAVPLDYTVPTGTEIIPRSISAKLNGGSAGGSFVPVLEVIAPSGVVTAYCARQVEIAAGASVLVSWFPGVAEADSASSGQGGAGGTIENISSPGGTLSVGSPAGPATTLDLAVSGVAAGTYGDATHTAQVTVNTDGIVTAAAQVPISGLAGSGLVKLFDSTLGANALSIDTGAGAIPGGHFGLVIYLYVRTNRAAANDDVGFRFNNDSGANYDDQQFSGANTGTAIGFGTGTSFFAQVVSATGFANSFTAIRIDVFNYDTTAGYKPVIVHAADAQNSGPLSIFDTHAAEWRSTAAITQFAVFSQTGSSLITGSRMSIFGLQ